MPENNNEFEVMTRARFHVFFRIYLALRNINDWKKVANSESKIELLLPMKEFFYNTCNNPDKLSLVINKINNNQDENGSTENSEYRLIIYLIKDESKIKISIEKEDTQKLNSFVENYLADFKGCSSFKPNKMEDHDECITLLPIKIQKEKILNAIKGGGGYLLAPFLKDDAPGDETYKRFCIEELLLLLEIEKTIELSYGGTKKHRDENIDETVTIHVYETKLIPHFEYKKWSYDLDGNITYNLNNELIVLKERTSKGNLIKENSILAILIRSGNKPINSLDLKQKLIELNHGEEFKTTITKLVNKISSKLKNKKIPEHIDGSDRFYKLSKR